MANLSHLQRVLALEDEALILLDIEMTLADAGVARVVTASTLDEALAALDTGRFDAAVLDLHIGQSGWSYEVAERLRALDVPFIFSSGTVDVVDGFADVPLLTKPFSSEQLLAALAEATSNAKVQAAQ